MPTLEQIQQGGLTAVGAFFVLAGLYLVWQGVTAIPAGVRMGWRKLFDDVEGIVPAGKRSVESIAEDVKSLTGSNERQSGHVSAVAKMTEELVALHERGSHLSTDQTNKALYQFAEIVDKVIDDDTRVNVTPHLDNIRGALRANPPH